MITYAGLDVHASTCTLAALDSCGTLVARSVFPTSEREVLKALKGLDGEVHLCMEETTQSTWLYRLVRRVVARCVVVGIQTRQRWRNKSDILDAIGLAEKVRLQDLNVQVFKDFRGMLKHRSLVKAYVFAVNDSTRAKNRLKSVYRSWGIHTDETVYAEEAIHTWLHQLPEEVAELARALHQAVMTTTVHRKQVLKAMLEEAKRFPGFKLLQTIPGIGVIGAAVILAVVVDARRFGNKRKFWSYCGLAVVVESSSDWQPVEGRMMRRGKPMTRGLTRRCSKALKHVFKQAAHTVVFSMPDSELAQKYHSLVAQGVKEANALVTIARMIAASTLAILKNHTKYNAAAHQPKPRREAVHALLTTTDTTSKLGAKG